MLNKRSIIKAMAACLVAAFLIQPAEAYARGGGRDYHSNYRHYPGHGRYYFWLPAALTALAIGSLTYYYDDGIYYRRSGYGYVVVPPPPGAIVREIPPVYVPVVINGATYYTCDGIYYAYTPQGYMVASAPPAQALVPQQYAGTVVEKIMPTVAVQQSDKTVTINIPNSKGGFSAVTLKKSQNGYIGPQGEFYPEFPSVEQLKVMYGKK
jgi:hypothetical protein